MTVFSSEWVENYNKNPEYTVGIGTYQWQECGLGWNLITLINSWIYYIVYKKNEDFSVIIDKHMFKELECENESNGIVNNGFECLFGNIPHLCLFDSVSEWNYDMLQKKVSGIEILDSKRHRDPKKITKLNGNIDKHLEKIGVDHMEAMAVICKHLFTYIRPWMRRDIDRLLSLYGTKKKFPYIGLHIRRGDKISMREAHYIDTKKYLENALDYLESINMVDEMKGIWVASDDIDVVGEVRELVVDYFPNIPKNEIIYISSGFENEVTTHSIKQKYSSFMYLMADLEKLSDSSVFIGTYSSNIGRLVAIIREGNGKDRKSSISLDIKEWFAGW